MKKIYLTLTILFLATGISFAKIRLISGDMGPIAAEHEFDIQYDYSAMAVADFPTEAAYVKDKKAKITKDDGAAKADEWEQKWIAAREKQYQPKFEELINDRGNVHMVPGNPKAKYTLIVKTTFLEPGFNVGVMRKPAAINIEYIFVEKGTTNEIAHLSAAGIPGADAMGFDYDSGARISEAYAKAGKMMAAFIEDSAPKKKK